MSVLYNKRMNHFPIGSLVASIGIAVLSQIVTFVPGGGTYILAIGALLALPAIFLARSLIVKGLAILLFVFLSYESWTDYHGGVQSSSGQKAFSTVDSPPTSVNQ